LDDMAEHVYISQKQMFIDK
jgi:hypothetical protein